MRINEPFGDGGELGSDPELRDRHHHAHARLQPRVRAQHARWRNLDHDQERVRLPGSRRSGLRRVVPAGGRRHRVRRFRRPGGLLRDRQRILRARLAGQHEHAHLAGVRQAELPRSGHQPGFQLHGREQHAERGAGDPDLLPRPEPRAELHVSRHIQERAHRVHAQRQAFDLRSEPAAGQPLLPRAPEQELQHQRQRRLRPDATRRARQHAGTERRDRRGHPRLGFRAPVQLSRQSRRPCRTSSRWA